MQNFLKKIFPWTLIMSVILPLIYKGGILYPYVTPKTLLLRSLGMIALSVFICLVVYKTPFYWNRLKNKLTWIPAFLLLVSYITSLLGSNFYHGFWSTFERGDGLFTLTIVVIFFYLFLLYPTRDFVEKVLKTIMWVAGIVAIYALLQWLEVATGMQIPFIEGSRGRIGSTFNNAAFMATYLSVTSILSIATANIFKPIKLRYIAYISAGLQLLAVFVSATRGAILAILFAVLLTAIYLAIKGTPKIRKISIAFLIICLFLGALFPLYKGSLAESGIEPLERIATVSLTEGTSGTRLYIWKELSKKAIEKPISGYGSENIDVPFNEIYDPENIPEPWFDRSHNSFLDYQLQYGIFGLIGYLAIILSIIWIGSRKLFDESRFHKFLQWLRLEKTEDNKIIGGAIVLATAVYAVNNFFVFDTAMSLWLLMFIFSAALVFHTDADKKALSISAPIKYAGIAISTIIILLLVPAIITPLRANLIFMEAYENQVSNPDIWISEIERGLSLDTYADLEYGYHSYNVYADVQSEQLNPEQKEKAHDLLEDLTFKNYQKYNKDTRSVLHYAHTLALDPTDDNRDDVLRVVDYVLELSPKRTHAWLIRANEWIALANRSESEQKKREYNLKAINILEEFLTEVPSDTNIYYAIANIYYSMGDIQQADKWMQKGNEVYGGNIRAASQAISYYIAIENYQMAVGFAEDIVSSNPEDFETAYDLAKLYYLTGQYEKSVMLYEQLLQVAPELVGQDQNFVATIENYINTR